MWSAFINGAGLHGGGGGYVPAQGWEFLPRSRIEKGDRSRGKTRSPLRRISSPPTVFSHIQEPQFGTSPSGGEGGAGTQLEILRGQMWPSPEPQHQQQQQQQQQTQHSRLKKKLEDLKKRHVQDKEEWMREKESLLREVANIQGGENRRILLDLKTVLEEVQAEVKREEEKRSELQLQYTRDRCAWELEKAELKCRIAQLEAREVTGLVSGGLHSATGLGSVTSQRPRESSSETSTLRREREEQRRILADTHSAAMDLRCRLEHSERDWLREKAELLQKFDVERREWENQLKDMQRKIEELYCEVGASRRGTEPDRKQEDNAVHRLSIQSTSTGSSLLSDNSRSELLSTSTQSEPTRNPPSPGFDHNRTLICDGDREAHTSTGFQADSLCGINVGGQFSLSNRLLPEHMEEFRSRETRQQDPVTNMKKAVDKTELEAFCFSTPGHGMPQEYDSKGSDHVGPPDSSFWGGQSYGSDKKKNNTALNAALKEIARVSEELCSYQDEIRKKSGDRRNQSESLHPPAGSEKLCGHDEICLQIDEAPCDLSWIYDDIRTLERENWITLSPDNTWQTSRGLNNSRKTNTADLVSCRGTEASLGANADSDTAAPPIPPRTSSWNLNTPNSETELHIPESPQATVRKCHSPCVLVDRKCSSPSIVRKFEAMLQENEGKIFKDGVLASCSVPANSNCNVDCCHNRWSCDASKFTHNKMSTYGTVQKSFSEVNILTARKDLQPDYSPPSGQLQMSPDVKELPVDLLLSFQVKPPASPNLQGSRRNLMLERKTAEFNRTLFQAEMGHGADVQDSFTETETSSTTLQPVLTTSRDILPSKETFQPIFTDNPTSIIDSHPKESISFSISNSTAQNSKEQPVQMRSEVQDSRINPESSPVLPPEQPQAGLRETSTTSQSPERHNEIQQKVPTAKSPSRKLQQRSATEPLLSESALPVKTHPVQPGDQTNSKTNSLHDPKTQSATCGASQQQPSTENKKNQVTQPSHKSGSPYPSDSFKPRVMCDHPWKPLTLAAYPRPEGSRSNYGAVERILKNYESAARAQQNEMASNSNLSCRQEESSTELEVLDMDPLPTLQTSHNPHAHVSSHSVSGVQEVQLITQEEDDPSVSSSSIQKSFSRPACPANRRLPSRWASCSPASPSSSPRTTPVVPSSFPFQKHSASFTYSHSFHIETIIM